jgi:hypothetical protein
MRQFACARGSVQCARWAMVSRPGRCWATTGDRRERERARRSDPGIAPVEAVARRRARLQSDRARGLGRRIRLGAHGLSGAAPALRPRPGGALRQGRGGVSDPVLASVALTVHDTASASLEADSPQSEAPIRRRERPRRSGRPRRRSAAPPGTGQGSGRGEAGRRALRPRRGRARARPPPGRGPSARPPRS